MSTSMTAKIHIHDLSFTYPDGTEALRHINLDIQPRQLFVLFGPSRSGKSGLDTGIRTTTISNPGP